MTDQDGPHGLDEPPPPAAPPTHAGDMRLIAPPEGWPTVVGVLGLVFGVLGCLMSACGVLGPFVGRLVADSSGLIRDGEQRAQFEAQMAAQSRYMTLEIASNAIELVLAVVLIIGSIMVLSRARACATTLRVYALADLASNVLVAVVGVLSSRAQAAALAEQPASQSMPLPTDVMAGLGTLMSVALFVGSAVWPIFLLIWFGRPNIRASIAKW